MRIAEAGKIVILPPKEGACWFCGDLHDGKEPHNAASLLYQHRFRKRKGRYPGWADAMAHCSGEVRKKWIKKLARKGIVIPEAAGDGKGPD